MFRSCLGSLLWRQCGWSESNRNRKWCLSTYISFYKYANSVFHDSWRRRIRRRRMTIFWYINHNSTEGYVSLCKLCGCSLILCSCGQVPWKPDSGLSQAGSTADQRFTVQARRMVGSTYSTLFNSTNISYGPSSPSCCGTRGRGDHHT